MKVERWIKPLEENLSTQEKNDKQIACLYIKYKDFLYDFKSYSQLFLKKLHFTQCPNTYIKTTLGIATDLRLIPRLRPSNKIMIQI